MRLDNLVACSQNTLICINTLGGHWFTRRSSVGSARPAKTKTITLPVIPLDSTSVPSGHRSVLLGQHDGDDAFGDRWVGRIRRVVGEGLIVIIDLEKDRSPLGLE